MRAGRQATFLYSIFAALFTFGVVDADAQDPVRLGPYVVDVRFSLPYYGQDPFVAMQRELVPFQLPARGVGINVGAHVYPLRLGAVTLGIGVEALASRGSRKPLLEELEITVDETTEDPLAPIVTRFDSISPQVSFNFGGTTGWSYLSGGLGPTTFSVAAAGVEDRGERRFSAVNYGGGGRWFPKDHLAVSLDLRFYSISPQEETDELPGIRRMTLMVFSIGVSIK